MPRRAGGAPVRVDRSCAGRRRVILRMQHPAAFGLVELPFGGRTDATDCACAASSTRRRPSAPHDASGHRGRKGRTTAPACTPSCGTSAKRNRAIGRTRRDQVGRLDPVTPWANLFALRDEDLLLFISGRTVPTSLPQSCGSSRAGRFAFDEIASHSRCAPSRLVACATDGIALPFHDALAALIKGQRSTASPDAAAQSVSGRLMRSHVHFGVSPPPLRGPETYSRARLLRGQLWQHNA